MKGHAAAGPKQVAFDRDHERASIGRVVGGHHPRTDEVHRSNVLLERCPGFLGHGGHHSLWPR